MKIYHKVHAEKLKILVFFAHFSHTNCLQNVPYLLLHSCIGARIMLYLKVYIRKKNSYAYHDKGDL